jgi:hypothetical protein
LTWRISEDLAGIAEVLDGLQFGASADGPEKEAEPDDADSPPEGKSLVGERDP